MNPDWLKVLDWLYEREISSPKDWPSELPPPSLPGFWDMICRIEQEQRAELSRKIELLISGRPVTLNPVERFLYSLRVQYALSRIPLRMADEAPLPPRAVEDLLALVLIADWTADEGFQLLQHAMRQPPPD